MRSFLRTLPPGLARDVAALAAAAFVIGVSFGAIAVASGVSGPKAVAMSVFVFAGGSQFLAVGVVGAGGTVLAAVLGGLVLNARHLPFGLAMGDVLGRHRLIGSHLIIDEAVAFTLARTDPAPGPAPAPAPAGAGANGRARRQAFWLAGGSLFVVWNIGTVVGVVAGSAVGDPNAFGIDAAFPAGMLALLLPALKDRPALRVALGAAVLALVAAPFLPPGLPVLVALLALVFALPVPRAARDSGATDHRGTDGRHEAAAGRAGRPGFRRQS